MFSPTTKLNIVQLIPRYHGPLTMFGNNEAEFITPITLAEIDQNILDYTYTDWKLAPSVKLAPHVEETRKNQGFEVYSYYVPQTGETYYCMIREAQ